MRSLTGAGPDRSRVLAVGTNLATDAVAVEVVGEFDLRGIRTLVLRGPGIARWLYREGERDYGDVDLLVEPDSVERAEEALRDLGFRGRPLHPLKHRRPRHAQMWVRATTPPVDLHRTIVGVAASDREVWAALRGYSKPITLHDVAVQTLDRTGLLVLLTLHAAQHGLEAATRDLAVALTRVGSEEWEQARSLATQLEALPAFGVGLRMFPAGREIADRLEIDTSPIPETLLRSEAAPDLALGLNWAADLPSTRLRARFIVSKVFPDANSMCASSGVARRGKAGLAAAYLQRLLWLSIRAPRAIRAVRRARRRANERAGR
jgi:putative nucleotidyltransferase-like protein